MNMKWKPKPFQNQFKTNPNPIHVYSSYKRETITGDRSELITPFDRYNRKNEFPVDSKRVKNKLNSSCSLSIACMLNFNPSPPPREFVFNRSDCIVIQQKTRVFE